MIGKVGLRLLLLLAALTLSAGTALARPSNYRAHLNGAHEVPPVATLAQGQAIFQLNGAGDALQYKLIVANIENVTAAHIHCGAAGVNGPVAVFLYGGGLIPGRFDGVLATGTVTSASSAGCAGNFAGLVALLNSGNAYVNVHTTQNPGGEIRGQIR